MGIQVRKRAKKRGPRRETLDDWRRGFHSHWVAKEYHKALDSEGLLSRAFGVGCNRCGIERESYLVWFIKGSGMSPLCKVCWDELDTAEGRMPWFRAVWLHWEMERLSDGCPYGYHTDGFPPFETGHNCSEWSEIKQAVVAADD